MTAKHILLSCLFGLVFCLPLYTLFEVYGSNAALADAISKTAIYTTITLLGLTLTLVYMKRKKEKTPVLEQA